MHITPVHVRISAEAADHVRISAEAADLPPTPSPRASASFSGLESIGRSSSSQSMGPIPHAQLPALILEPLAAARSHLHQFRELQFFMDRQVAVTQEGTISTQAREGSYCAQLHMTFAPELERSLQSLHCLDLLLDGSTASHENFTASQAEPRLSFEHFTQLNEQLHRLLNQFVRLPPHQVLEAFRAGLVLGDIGKSPEARRQMTSLGIDQPDHDDFYAAVLQHPTAAETLSSFHSLNTLQKQLLRATSGLAHFGHLAHCEGGPAMYQPLRISGIVQQAPHLLDFALLMHTCDVAGALAHTSNKGARPLNDDTFTALQATRASCLLLADHDEMVAYQQYLQQRAMMLGLSDSSDKISMHLLARLGASLRLFGKEAGKTLRTAFQSLGADDRLLAQETLGPEGAARLPRTPTYAPAVLVNLINNPSLGKTPQDRANAALQIGLPFLGNALRIYCQRLDQEELPPELTLNFNSAAALARDMPEKLRGRINIDRYTGSVLLS
nr:hypothetical protein [Pseudomonas sp. GL-B-16]